MKTRTAILSALLAAALYALNAPLSKLLLASIPPTMMAAFLYLGAGAGMLALGLVRRAAGHPTNELPLTRRDLPYTIGMIVLDILAPIFLMLGISRTTAANAALLNNFEIVATTLIALLIFREKVSRKLWLAIGLIVVSSALLTVEDASSLQFSWGSVYVLLACCWGMENNCTRMLSGSDPQEIVVVKGFGSGTGALIAALLTGEHFPPLQHVLPALLLGFVAYGLSIYFYVYAQRHLGAARTSAYYAVAPFIGVLLSLVIFRELPGAAFFAALLIMIAATVLVTKDQAKTEQTHCGFRLIREPQFLMITGQIVMCSIPVGALTFSPRTWDNGTNHFVHDRSIRYEAFSSVQAVCRAAALPAGDPCRSGRPG